MSDAIEQLRLQRPRRHTGGRRRRKSAAGRELAHCLRRTLRQHLTLMQHDRATRALGLIQITRGEQHGEALVVHQVPHDGPQLTARERIDSDRRLIEQQQLGLAYQRAGEAEFLLHAARELPGQAALKRPERGHLEQPWVALCALRGADAVQVRIQIEVLGDAQILVQTEALRHVTDAILHRLRHGYHIDAEHLEAAGIGPHESRDQPHQRRFARAVGADQRGQLTLARLDRDRFERGDGGLIFGSKHLVHVVRAQRRHVVWPRAGGHGVPPRGAGGNP